MISTGRVVADGGNTFGVIMYDACELHTHSQLRGAKIRRDTTQISWGRTRSRTLKSNSYHESQCTMFAS
jgi:hypothetical protein